MRGECCTSKPQSGVRTAPRTLLVQHLQNLVGSANYEICKQVAKAAGLPLELIFPEKVKSTKPEPGSTRDYSTVYSF